MTTRKKLFISYRRKSWGHATQLRDNLARLLDADIFMDFTSIDQDEFETSILSHLQSSDVVLVVVTDHTFDPARIHNDNDWVRREIREALQLKKPIALACFDGLFPPTDLPDDIRAVRNKEGKRLYPEFFDAGCNLLAAHIATIGDIPLRTTTPTPLNTQPAAPSAPPATNFAERRATIENLIEANDYAKAVFELESLIEAGFKSTRFWNAESILAEALQLRDESARRDQMHSDYAEIASSERLARTPRRRLEVAQAWDQFLIDYPEFSVVDDTGNLLAKLAVIQAQSPQKSTISPEQQRLLDIMLDPQHYDPTQRAEAGRQLAEIGDPRPGVGLRPDGLPDLVWCEVPAGEFVYQKGEKRTLPTFWITKYPITYRQFQAFLDAPDGYNNKTWWQGLHTDALEQQQSGANEQHFKYANHPRDSVSWYEAMAFCVWLSAKLSQKITLPTEEQWEKAARGTDGHTYSFGDNFDPNKANTKETALGMTNAVGIFPDPALPYAVLDMCGNVWEWCLNKYETGKPDLSSNGSKALRGGSWSDDQDFARAAFRVRYFPSFRDLNVGFRVVVGLRPPPES